MPRREDAERPVVAQKRDEEWLYAMVWWEGDQANFMLPQSLVLESEGRPDPLLDGDFQKLGLVDKGILKSARG
jgi:hypothetical protein